MEFYDVISTRRSIRAFKPDAISDDCMARVLEGIRIAPSGSNRQPWKFIVVTGKETKERLVPACKDQRFIAEAPAIIVACSLKISSNRGNYMGEFSALIDVSIAVDHLTLAARNEGLGTCWIGAYDNEEVKKILSIPDDIQVVALVPVGYPREEGAFAPVKSRKEIQEIVCYEKWS
jgi:nitroreductase